MKDLIKGIINWNDKRGNLESFDKSLEFRLLFEELLEGLEVFSSKDVLKSYVSSIIHSLNYKSATENIPISDKITTETLDSYLDILFVVIGSLSKVLKVYNENLEIKLNSNQLTELILHNLNLVLENNNLKGSKKDDNGKIIKDTNHKAPKLILSYNDLP